MIKMKQTWWYSIRWGTWCVDSHSWLGQSEVVAANFQTQLSWISSMRSSVCPAPVWWIPRSSFHGSTGQPRMIFQHLVGMNSPYLKITIKVIRWIGSQLFLPRPPPKWMAPDPTGKVLLLWRWQPDQHRGSLVAGREQETWNLTRIILNPRNFKIRDKTNHILIPSSSSRMWSDSWDSLDDCLFKNRINHSAKLKI